MTSAAHQFSDTARAKVNLSLRIIGRRPDGYHELESLVAFADIGDFVTLRKLAGEPDCHGLAVVETTGRFAAAIAGVNIVDRAVALVREVVPEVGSLHVSIAKQLPVAAGLGGGSADAAAVLRLMQRAWPEIRTRIDWAALALRLGADVPVCLVSAPQMMRGVGEELQPVVALPKLSAVLANPLQPVPGNKTSAVFRALASGPVASTLGSRQDWWSVQTSDELIAQLQGVRNDLQRPASEVMPFVAEVLAELERLPGARLARLSGAGPTCFALFGEQRHAIAAAEDLGRRQPGWWVTATVLG